MNYNEAKALADKLAVLIKPGCVRLEIVGSVKRGKETGIHDIEFLCIGDTRTPRPEFGQDPKNLHKTMLDKVLCELEQAGVLKFIKGGDRLKQYAIREVRTLNPFCLELWIVRAETWAIQNVIRTGPSLFSQRFVTNKSAVCFHKQTGRQWPGLLPDQYKYIRGATQIIQGEQVLSLPEESDALTLLGMGWIPPEDRARVAVRR